MVVQFSNELYHLAFCIRMKYAPLSCGFAALLVLSACRSMEQPPLLPDEAKRVQELRQILGAVRGDVPTDEYVIGSYEYFISHRHYLDAMTAFRDPQLLEKATADSPVYICLSQQRGRLYVDGQVALDWPVSTGTDSKPTSRGTFRILEKKKEHFSGRFGSILDAEGKVLVADADSRKHTVPAGCTWKGAEMPNWMRLTDTGIGMHTGQVIPGKRLSHGCIRMPHVVSSLLFDILEIKSPVYVQEGVESCFPCKQALALGDEYRAVIKASEGAQEELDTLLDAAQTRAEAERARRKAEEKAAEEARERAEEEAEARAKAERARLKAEQKAAEEARERAEEEAEAKAKAERRAAIAAAKAERARLKAEQKAAEEARERAEEEAEAKAKSERRAAIAAAKAERARLKAEQKAAEEARERAEEEAEAKAKAERRAAIAAAKAERARRKAEEEAAEEARERAEEEYDARVRIQRARLRAAEQTTSGGSWWQRLLRRVGL